MSSNQPPRPLKFWGWGYEDEQPSPDEVRAAAAGAREHLGFEPADPEQPVPIEAVELAPPRVDAPAALSDFITDDRHERITHAYGKAYRDIVRAFRGRIDHPPDLVARPRDEREVAAVLAWCAAERVAVIPFGGGTSVVGGVEPRIGDAFAGALSLDMRALDRVLEVDETSLAARIEGGALGPGLEAQLAEHGLTLRHFPQSFEFSTLGGWIATRSGGHFASLATHIDELVESVRAITPSGVWESRRLPGSGAGPSPDRVLIGSEGILGVITEAWVRVRRRPVHRASASVAFDTFEQGCAAARDVVQAGLWPSNCRLLDGEEAAITGVRTDGRAMLMLGFESAAHPVDHHLELALELCGDGDAERGSGGSGGWRSAFLKAPYLRDTLIAGGVLIDTFETAVTWGRLDDFVRKVRKRAADAAGERSHVTCRLTHVYPDGAAPYFTVIAPARRGEEVEQWDEIKRAASDLLIEEGATITHHHAVGRDHRPWYDDQRPDEFARALKAAKAELDPASVMNPGVLL